MTLKNGFRAITFLFSFMILASSAFAGEADIILPDLTQVSFNVFGGALGGVTIMYFGLVICIIGLIFALIQARHTKNLPAHKAMLDVSNIIWETCKAYLFQQGKFLIILWTLIAICMVYYFIGLSHKGIGDMIIILACSILGILGSYSVAWFGMRINTWANSRSAFASLRGRPINVVNIPLTSGMSVGLLLVSVEL
ncbi:MAG TPA: sodium/proton-translocating pyrophosphatase, partial [Desulfatiglandales bacterium]|nr:sodium/proton-translocating pyrophosphatase [Desulfatiglandales bacterium]